MARRELEEINAGSMADIAFLLLIFFIVTTTMDLEAGIPANLPLKIDSQLPPPEVQQRNIFAIQVNNNDELLIEGERHLIEDIDEMLYSYFMTNVNKETDEKWAFYYDRNTDECRQKIQETKQALLTNPEDLLLQSRLGNWEKRLEVCEVLDGSFRELPETAVIQIKQQSKSSYGNYISIMNEVKKVIHKVKDERCQEIYGMSYDDLDLELPEDQDKERVLRVLVPERIIEPAITN